MVENQRDNIVNHPVDQQMALNKEQASLYERMLAIEKEKNALFGGVAERKVGSCEVRRTFHDDRLRRREDSCRGNI